MSISKRFVRLLKADIHGILDCLEEPESLLKQAIRDMEEQIQILDEEVNSKAAEAEKIAQKLGQVASSKSESERQLDLCFRAGNEGLARNFVRRRLEAEQRQKLLHRQAADIARELESSKQKQAEQQEKLASIRDKAELFSESVSRGATSAESCDCCFVSEEQVELALMEERERRSQVKSANEI